MRNGPWSRMLVVAAVATFSAAPSGWADPADPIPVLPGEVIRSPGPRVLGFAGLAADPSSIGNFRGVVALAYLRGRVRDPSGRRLITVDDIRVMQGDYVSADGTARRGTFAFL